MPAPRLKKVVDEVHAISARRGIVTEIPFESFEEIEALFEGELHQLLKRGSI